MTDLDPEAVLDALADHPTLRAFLRDRAVVTMPAKMAKRRLLLGEIVLAFEPGIRYPERQVDDFLRRIHPDHAALRRYLVDEELVDRGAGQYWRTGNPAHYGPALLPAGRPDVPASTADAGAQASALSRSAAASMRSSVAVSATRMCRAPAVP